MPAFTVTTTPQLVYTSDNGTVSRPTSFGAQVKNGVTGTVTIGSTQAACVVDQACYFSENSSITSIDLVAGDAVWMVVGSGTVVVVYDTWGPA